MYRLFRALVVTVTCAIAALAIAAGPATAPSHAAAPAHTAAPPVAAPFTYVPATAVHVLPSTHNRESGFGSLCVGLDGSIYIGTAKIGVNGYLVEFDPASGEQRIVVDAQKTCGLATTGYAAQASIGTPNFVAPSGRIYLGSDHGTPTSRDQEDHVTFAGGHVLTYDPRIGQAEDLGVPRVGEGVSDVVADEPHSQVYVVTSDHQHWMAGDISGGKFRDLGPSLAPGATTIVDARGIASALALIGGAPASGSAARGGGSPSPAAAKGDAPERAFQLVQHDPATGRVTAHNLILNGERLLYRGDQDRPYWVLGPDGHTAYMVRAGDAMLLSIDLDDASPLIFVRFHGRLIDGAEPQLHAGLTFSPDGRLYTLVRVANRTGYGIGELHHLVRFDPATNRSEDLGVVVVRNPDFFKFTPAGMPGKEAHLPAWCHGFQGFPDGTMAPMLNHQAIRAARDGTLYATFLNPFTLLRFDDFKLPPPSGPATPTRRYVGAVLAACDRTEQEIPRFTEVAQVMAQRYIDGGMIGFDDRLNSSTAQCLDLELLGRGGGIVHIGFDRPWKPFRTPAEKANDMMIVDWERPPDLKEISRLREFKKRKGYLVGFGPANMPQIVHQIELCDAFFDTGVETDGVLPLPDGTAAGRLSPPINCIRGWVLCAEFVAALTRQGKMPTMWKSYNYSDGKEWGSRYFGRMQFHDDYSIAPQAAGSLSRAYLQRARYDLRAFAATQQPAIDRAAAMIVAELAARKKVLVAWSGHMPIGFVGKFEDRRWSSNREFNFFIESEAKDWAKTEPEGLLVVMLGELGIQGAQIDLHRQMKQRVIAICGQHAYPNYQGAYKADLFIYDFAPMGDACVPIEGYPIRVFPTSGFMAATAYESLDAEVYLRLAAAGITPAAGPTRH